MPIVLDGTTGIATPAAVIGNGYYLKGVTYLTSGTAATYTTPVGVRAIEVEVIGAGGGGGGTDGTDTASSGAGGTGGGGGWSRALITSVSASYTYTVGAGGTGGPAGNNVGGTGGTTSFAGGGVTISATGGNGGFGNLIDGSNNGTPGLPGQGSVTGVTGEAGGGSPGNNMRFVTSTGFTSYAFRGFCPLVGTSALYGYGTDGAEGVGSDGTLPGEGGNGSYTSTDTSNRAGGAGFRGRIKITEFY
jgi:hypothetical protein